MKLKRKIISTLILLTLISPISHADIFRMKNGTSIKGSIISETYNSYTLRAEVSKNAYEQKVILKSKILKITKTDHSIAAYQKLKSILPTPDLLSAKDYELLINKKVKPFLEEHKSSAYFSDVEKLLTTLQKEYHIIKSGGFKLNGELLTPDRIEANKYDIQASVKQHNFIKHVKNKQYHAALSTLETLENGYADTKQCRSAQETALFILPRYQKQLHILHKNVDILTKKRKRAIDSMTPNDSSRTKKIFAYQDRQYQNRLDIAKANNKKHKWLPINKYFKDPIESNLKMIENEIKRISIAVKKPTMDLGGYYRETCRALDRGNYELAKESFKKFKTGKPPIEILNELEPRLLDAKSLEERLVIQRKAEQELAKKKAAEEKRRLTILAQKRAAEARRLQAANDKDISNKVRDKLNLNKKQETIDNLSK